MTGPHTVANGLSEAAVEVQRLQRNLDITNADHIALWIEQNTIPDEPMNQCASWLACRIVEAHEAAVGVSRTRLVGIIDGLTDELERVRGELRAILQQKDQPHEQD